MLIVPKDSVATYNESQVRGDEESNGKGRPLVLWIHGGALTIGSAHDAYLGTLMKVVDGYLPPGELPIWASVEYRMAPRYKFPTAQLDCLRALTHLLTSANSHSGHVILQGGGTGKDMDASLAVKVDLDRVVIAGSSAGGYLAATVGRLALLQDITVHSLLVDEPMVMLPQRNTDPEGSYIRNHLTRVIPPCFLEVSWRHFAGSRKQEEERALLQVLEVKGWRKALKPRRGAMPPMHVLVATGDPLHDGGVQLAKVYREAGGSVNLTSAATPHVLGNVLDRANFRAFVGGWAKGLLGSSSSRT